MLSCRVYSIQIQKVPVETSTTQAKEEEMRLQRSQEVRQMIGSSVNNAKAIFAQNTAAGQLTNKTTKMAPVKPVRNSITRTANNQQQQQQQVQQPQPQQTQSDPEVIQSAIVIQQPSNNELQEYPVVDHQLEEEESDPYSTIKRSPYTKVANNSQNEANDSNKSVDHVQMDASEAYDVASAIHAGMFQRNFYALSYFEGISKQVFF